MSLSEILADLDASRARLDATRAELLSMAAVRA